jgi:hypothetical protein
MDPFAGFHILLGAVECFFGYRIYKLLLGILGLCAGWVAAYLLGLGLEQTEGVALLLGLLGGIIGAVLVVFLRHVGIFLLGGLLGGAIAVILAVLHEGGVAPAFYLVLATTGGVVALAANRLIIIVSTSFLGAWHILIGLLHFSGERVNFWDHLLTFRTILGPGKTAALISWIALGIVGAVLQLRWIIKKESEDEANSVSGP